MDPAPAGVPTAAHNLTAAHPHSNEVFCDSSAGLPIDAGNLRAATAALDPT